MDKTYVFDGMGSDGNILGLLAPMLQQRGVDPNVLLALNKNNNGWGGEGGWFMWIIFLFFLMGWGGNGYGFGRNNGAGTGFLANEISNDYGRDLLLQAINGNRSAIDTLASTLNCSVNSIQQAICALQGKIQDVGNQVGMGTQQVINAVQNGNCSISQQLAACCCDVKTAIERQGYENRIATLEQTGAIKSEVDNKFTVLAAKIDAQTQIINDNFCNLEKRELQREIDALRDERTAYQMSALTQAQTQNIVNQIKPCPIPAYITCNPYSGVGANYIYGFENGNSCC